jgi:DNA mismatch endonuclease (patch repair protein)
VVVRRLKKAIFVNGCFWHLHAGCSKAWVPSSSRESPYWAEKLIRNALRDQRVERELRNLGWEVLVVWECETTDLRELRAVLREFLAAAGQGSKLQGQKSTRLFRSQPD